MVSRARFWLLFPLVAPLAAWSVQGAVGWWIAERACPGGHAAAPALGHTAARVLMTGLSAIAMAVTAAAVLVAYRSRQRCAAGVDADARERGDFLAAVGMVLAAVLGLAVLWAGLPALLVRVCGETR